ncbi:UNVERIFIED_CONTAM: hypothetical protein NCL1_37535 [Trichonephila clavipes]
MARNGGIYNPTFLCDSVSSMNQLPTQPVCHFDSESPCIDLYFYSKIDLVKKPNYLQQTVEENGWAKKGRYGFC